MPKRPKKIRKNRSGSPLKRMILTIFEGPYSVCEPPLQGGAMHCVLIDQNARKAIFARMLVSVFADMLRLIIGEPKVRVRLTLALAERTRFAARTTRLGRKRSQTSTGSLLCTACPSSPPAHAQKKSQGKRLPWLFSGRGRRTRTHDPWFWRPVLYQLSYTPVTLIYYTKFEWLCQ